MKQVIQISLERHEFQMEKINGLQMINDPGFGVGKCGEKKLAKSFKEGFSGVSTLSIGHAVVGRFRIDLI